MSLFQFGFTRVNSLRQTSQSDDSCSVPDYLPLSSESGLGVEEHHTVTSVVSELADPEPTRKRRKTMGHYIHYSDEDRASIGKYVAEHGNKRARKKFSGEYPDLSESTVRNFKKRYLDRMAQERKKQILKQLQLLAIEKEAGHRFC